MKSSNPTISHSMQHLIKKLVQTGFYGLLVTLFLGCNTNDKPQKSTPVPGKVVLNFKEYKTVTLSTNTGRVITAYLARSDQEQTQGLSGIKPDQLADNEAMLFEYEKAGPRSFWMPNTYTNLDIFFLDTNYKVLYVERNVPAHPGMKEPIPRTKTVFAHHVLELKASSPLSKEIKVGEILNRSH
ncbi:MAG: DUF192 domain-containing protein [Halobacteriovoraceae bacterium]|nr:DUF192 domain-containing protein [Halobacteriovoraceae bacterium]